MKAGTSEDMMDIAHIARGSEGSAVRDIQARLCSLGYDLEKEAEQGIFGPLTARAVAGFREGAGLAPRDDIDRDTWTALVDATFTFGDRLLYLRMPHFHGRDVRTLQTALAALGFSCMADGIFGGHTERAVREFQHNAGIDSDGIVGDSTFSAIKRLRHAWEGKDQLALETRSLGFARAEEVLENTPVAIIGVDSAARGVAERISNLAMATTAASKIVSVPSPEQAPDGSAIMLRLTSAGSSMAEEAAVAEGSIPQVIYDSDETINARMATAIGLANGKRLQIAVRLAFASRQGSERQGELSAREEQHAAVVLLDALCLAL